MCETYTAIFVGTHTLPVRCRESDPVPSRIHMTMVVKVSDHAGENTKHMDKYWEMATQESACLLTAHIENRYRGL
jgi:hypothetical protein